MILIRLKRKSFNDKLKYTIVVTSNKFAPNSSQFIEKIGYYNPLVDKWSNKYIFVDFDRLKFWLERGAKVNISLFVLMRSWFGFYFLSQLSGDVNKKTNKNFDQFLEQKTYTK